VISAQCFECQREEIQASAGKRQINKAKASNCVRRYLGVFLCVRTMSASRDAKHKTLGDRPNTHEASPRQASTPRRWIQRLAIV
jgi:hypothetical protein